MIIPLPPPELMARVSGNTDRQTYLEVGERAARRLMETVTAWSTRPVKDVLDWGCGPGRVAAHIARSYPQIVLRGCDIDAEAIAWAHENIPDGWFTTSPLYPPLPYKDASFDAVLAVSVMTHLRRRNQRRWLKDIARVLRPGGLFVASVHGRAQAKAFKVDNLTSIEDHYINGALDGIAPPGYYRDVIQAESYTRDAWSEHFDIVAYDETALELHDLVTCRKK